MLSFIHTTLGLCVLSILPLSALGQQPGKPPKFVLFEHDGWRTSVAFSPDGKTVATGANDNQIRLFDIATRKERLAITAHGAKQVGISRLAYFPDGKMLASAGGDSIKLWEVGTGGERQEIATKRWGFSLLEVSPDGKILAFGEGGTIRLHDMKTGRVGHSLSVRMAVDSAAFSHDSKFLATANGDGSARIWNVTTGETVRVIPAGVSTATGSQGVAFSPDGKILATASRKIRLWKVATGEEIAALGVADEIPFCIAISPDGRFLACGARHGALRLWEMATHKQIHSWHEPTYSVAFSPDSKWLAFGQMVPHGGASLVEIGALGK